MVVEGEAQLQQQPALDDAARELRVARVAADGAEQDGVVLGELLEGLVAENLAGREVVRGTERVVGLRDRRLVAHGGAQDAQRLGGDFGADAVAGDDGEVEGAGAGHGASIRQFSVNGQDPHSRADLPLSG